MDPNSEHPEQGLPTSEDSYRTASKDLGTPTRWIVTEAHDDTFYKLLRWVTMGYHLRAGERLSTPAQIEERVNHICRVRYSFMANLYKLERMDAKLVRQCNLCRPCGGKFKNRIATLNFYSECGKTQVSFVPVAEVLPFKLDPNNLPVSIEKMRLKSEKASRRSTS